MIADVIGLIIKKYKGGKGSGFYGHAGRPGKRGGSAPDKGGVSYGLSPEQRDGLGLLLALGEDHKNARSFKFVHALIWYGENSYLAGAFYRGVENPEQYARKMIIAGQVFGLGEELNNFGIERLESIAREYEIELEKNEADAMAYKNDLRDFLNYVEDLKARIGDAQNSFGSGVLPESFSVANRSAYKLKIKLTEDGKRLSNLSERRGVRILSDLQSFIDRGHIKDQICYEISQESGVDYNVVNRLLLSWADSSNKNGVSVAMQSAAAEIFGTDIPAYTKRHINAHERDILEYGNYGEIKKVLQTMYNRTQKRLADMGYGEDDEIVLYRGVRRTEKALKKYPLRQGMFLYSGSPLESWSCSVAVARKFAKSKSSLITMSVKRKNIFCTCTTGLGCFPEDEVVVLGNKENYRVEFGV